MMNFSCQAVNNLCSPELKAQIKFDANVPFSIQNSTIF
jgi:hypothetical protein